MERCTAVLAQCPVSPGRTWALAEQQEKIAGGLEVLPPSPAREITEGVQPPTKEEKRDIS